MKRKIYDNEGHAHFVTFSCYRRRRHLDGAPAKRVVLEQMRTQLERTAGTCVGFVIMPNHVHAIVRHTEPGMLAEFMKQWKRMTSYLIARRRSAEAAKGVDGQTRDPIWQARYYDYNVYSRPKTEEKLRYMHQNPVRAGLVARAIDWPWGSARFYELGENVGVPISWLE